MKDMELKLTPWMMKNFTELVGNLEGLVAWLRDKTQDDKMLEALYDEDMKRMERLGITIATSSTREVLEALKSELELALSSVNKELV